MIRLITTAGFVLAVATSAQEMTTATIQIKLVRMSSLCT
jgi:hypothetical protein